MCLGYNLQLYLRCAHLFKLLFACYTFVYGVILCADVSLRQAFGSDMLFLGILLLLLGVTKPCNILLGHYGSMKHNKCALLLVVVFDATAAVVQCSVGLILLTRGTPTYDLDLRKACARSSVLSQGRCDAYWRDDRTAGMRLAWMSFAASVSTTDRESHASGGEHPWGACMWPSLCCPKCPSMPDFSVVVTPRRISLSALRFGCSRQRRHEGRFLSLGL
mmetsp:Transcript_14130/g.46126  ORF Transcript_14130/g.46126 Transcript_14130/m.46126 type:complete len:219 (-) Transcript_14130:729-1385(-)